MLKQKSFLSFGVSIFGSFLGFVSVFFVSRFMGPEAMGAISSSIAFAGLFAIFGDFGFGIAHFKKVSEGQDLGNCITTFFFIRLATTLMMAIITILVFYLTYFFTGRFPIEEKYIPIFYIVFFSGLIGNMLYVITYTFTARIEKAKESASIISQKFVMTLGKVIASVSGLSIIFLAWSNLAGVIAGALVSLFLFRKYPIGKFNKVLFKSYFLYALPSIMIGVTYTISMNLDKVFISYFSGTENVGYYTSAQSLILIIASIGTIFVSLLLPTYSGLHAQGKMNEIRILANRVERYISILLMPLVFFVFFFADPIRQIILGSKFEASTPIISILVLNAMFVIFNQPYSSQLLGTNQIKLGMNLGIIMLLINLFLNFIFIPMQIFGVSMLGLGAVGAALSLLISSIIGTGLVRYFAFKTSGSKPNYKVFIHLIIAIASFGTVYLLNNVLVFPIYFIPVYFIIGLGIYLFLMFIFKEFNKSDLQYYLSMISPKLMKNYIKHELKDNER